MWPDANETQRLLRQVEQLGPAAEEELWERHRPALRRMIGLRLECLRTGPISRAAETSVACSNSKVTGSSRPPARLVDLRGSAADVTGAPDH